MNSSVLDAASDRCAYCGTALLAGARECDRCGAPIAVPSQKVSPRKAPWMAYYALLMLVVPISLLFVVFGSTGARTPRNHAVSPYAYAATWSVRAASQRVGNFPTAQERADYVLGVAHVAHVHGRIESYSIGQVLRFGRAIRESAMPQQR